MDIVERFLNYTRFDTQSGEDSEQVPSTAKQLVFAQYLRDELLREGFSDVEMDDKGYIYATLKSNSKKKIPTIGFISHYDTSPDCSGKDVKARIVKAYQGGDIELSPGIVSSPSKFPELNAHIGEDLIVTDGHTLLGADDKAGIAEIVQAMCYLRDHDGIEWAYTIDGGDLGDLEYENFNAAGAKVHIKGVSVHTGYAKGKMVNANRLACEFNACIPDTDIPETTEGYEGFYHLLSMETRTEEARMSYIIRDHDRERFEERKRFFGDIAARMNAKYGEGTVTVELRDQHYNMKEKIDTTMHVIDIVLKAMEQAGVTPKVEPIRGGTDGAQLSFKGLPCPNIFAGGVNFHGPHEFVSVQVMQKAVDVIVRICEITGAQ